MLTLITQTTPGPAGRRVARLCRAGGVLNFDSASPLSFRSPLLTHPPPRPPSSQNPNDPEHQEFSMLGYKFYGGLVGAVVGSLLIILYRFGLFAALT
jgi:hypothetical protein